MVDAQTQQLFQRLNNAYGSLMRSPEVRGVRQGTAIWNFMNEVGQVIRQYSTMPQQAQQPAAQAMKDAQQLVSLAHWLDEAGAHAMADVVDEAAGMVAEAASPYTHFYHFFYLVKNLFNSFQTVVMGEDPKTLDKEWLTNFGREWQRLLQRYSRFAENPKYKYSRQASLVGRLTAMAQLLDDRGEHARADLIDTTADYVRRFADDQQQDSPFKPLNEIPLSTRYCPDHIGVQTSRISDRAVQCPLDGRVYNYETGYTDYDGKKVPGGTVAAQTPSAMPYGIPNRVYDSRQSVINTMN